MSVIIFLVSPLFFGILMVSNLRHWYKLGTFCYIHGQNGALTGFCDLGTYLRRIIDMCCGLGEL